MLWIIIAFLLQQVGNNIVISGMGSTYIYFQYGYNGAMYSTFSTVGVAATAILMVGFPMISHKVRRKQLMNVMLGVAMVGYVLMLLTGFVLTGTTIGYWILTIGYMLANFGQYGFYLIMMIAILNTVEYNEYISGNRDEAVIASVRPFVTKMASAIALGITSICYVAFNVIEHTNQISGLEQAATSGELDAIDKLDQIDQTIQGIANGQKLGLLLAMVIIPCVMLVLSYIIYQKKYPLDEDEYNRICAELQARKTEQ